MNRIFRHKYSIFNVMALMVTLMLSTTGCIMDNEEPETTYEGMAMVSFRVVTPNRSAVSRSVTPPDANGTWGNIDPSDPGTEFDNLLLRDQFKVVITNNDCSQTVATVENVYCVTTTTSNGASKTYEFLGIINDADVDAVKLLTNGKLHVVANAGSGDNLLADATSFQKYGQELDAIPMWGVATVTNFSELKKGERFDAGDVWLLRAMAKVEIAIAADKDNVKNCIVALESASVTGVNIQGYLLPLDWSEVSDTKSLTYDQSLRALQSLSSISEMTPTDSEKNKIVFYLPETENSNGTSEVTLNYTIGYEDGTTLSSSRPIKFAEYRDGKLTDTHYNIVRNHLYRFDVFQSSQTDMSIDLIWTVCNMDNGDVTIPPFE